jgi:hypothetical protein
MKRSILIVLIAGACLAAGALAARPSPAAPDAAAAARRVPWQNAVLIGWDGAQRQHVKESLQQGELPHLHSLARRGRLVAIDIMRTTDTKSGWAQILSGYQPEKTGVFSNSRFQPIPDGYTVFERLEAKFGADGIATLAVIGKGENVSAEPGYPFANARADMDHWENGLGANDVVGPKALALLEQYKDRRFFLFVHLADIDAMGHAYGENSQQYDDALVSSDAWTGRIIAKLRELGLYRHTRVYVTTDHGFNEAEKGHWDAPWGFLATNDPRVMRRGGRADVAPTILEPFDIHRRSVTPLIDGHSLRHPAPRRPLF